MAVSELYLEHNGDRLARRTCPQLQLVIQRSQAVLQGARVRSRLGLLAVQLARLLRVVFNTF